jgi:hypothetical protein
VIVRHKFPEFLRIEPRRNLGRADQIAEKNRQMTALANDVPLLDVRCLRDWSGYGRTKGNATFSAELRARGIVRAALRTAGLKYSPAFRAELLAFRILEFTA